MVSCSSSRRSAYLSFALGLALASLWWWQAGARPFGHAALAADDKPFVHIPDTISKQAREFLMTFKDPANRPENPRPNDLEGWKKAKEAFLANVMPLVEPALKRYEPSVVERKLGGVSVIDVKPKGWKDNGKVLVYVHGGAYTFQTARSTLPRAILGADTTGLRVISVDYTTAPAGKWPQPVDEVIAVLQALQKDGYPLKNIAAYGDSAGGGLVPGAILKMRDRGEGMPAAVVLWSPWADITDSGDTAVTLKHAEPVYLYEKHLKRSADAYVDPKDQKHPYVSPVYADFTKGFPPTLIQGGTKEIFLSHFVRLYQALDSAGQTVKLDLYEGMPHVFQNRLAEAPEGMLALRKMKAFLERHLGK